MSWKNENKKKTNEVNENELRSWTMHVKYNIPNGRKCCFIYILTRYSSRMYYINTKNIIIKYIIIYNIKKTSKRKCFGGYFVFGLFWWNFRSIKYCIALMLKMEDQFTSKGLQNSYVDVFIEALYGQWEKKLKIC